MCVCVCVCGSRRVQEAKNKCVRTATARTDRTERVSIRIHFLFPYNALSAFDAREEVGVVAAVGVLIVGVTTEERVENEDAEVGVAGAAFGVEDVGRVVVDVVVGLFGRLVCALDNHSSSEGALLLLLFELANLPPPLLLLLLLDTSSVVSSLAE